MTAPSPEGPGAGLHPPGRRRALGDRGGSGSLLGLGWASLLPAALAREALRPQVPRDSTGAGMGLGRLLNEPKDICGHAGGGPGAASSLIVRMSTGQPSVALANRLVPIEPVNARLARPIA